MRVLRKNFLFLNIIIAFSLFTWLNNNVALSSPTANNAALYHADTIVPHCLKVSEYFNKANAFSVHRLFNDTQNYFLKAIYVINNKMSDSEKLNCEYIHQVYHNYANYHASVGNVNETTFYFQKALESKRQGITLTQYALYLSTQDQIFKAYDFLKEASEVYFVNEKDIEIRAATLLPVVSSNRKSLDAVLHFLDKRLSILEKKWYDKPSRNQLNPQSLLRWSPTIYRLHYLSKNMSLNLNFLKRKAKLNFWMTNSLNYIAKHLMIHDEHRGIAENLHYKATQRQLASSNAQYKIKIGFFTMHFCKSHSLYMHAGHIIENLPRNTFHVYYIRSNAVMCANDNDNVIRANLDEDTDVYIDGQLDKLEAARLQVANLKLLNEGWTKFRRGSLQNLTP